MSHETLKLNRLDKYDPNESEILITFKYHAGSPGYGIDPPEPDEIEILKIEAAEQIGQDWEKGKDITDLISADEYEQIEQYIWYNWQSSIHDDEADYRYEMWKEERDRE